MTHPINLPHPVKWSTSIYRRRFLTFLMVANHRAFRADFSDWLQKNWHIWEAFEEAANKVRARGFQHYSARMIWYSIRHETALREGPNQHGWKLNNNFSPDAARLYMLVNNCPDFFEKRVNPTSVRAA